MTQEVNSIYKPLWTVSDKRYFILMGGRGAGRSTVASQFLLSNLIAPKYFRASIMRAFSTDIRKSIWQELVDRISEQKLNEIINLTDNDMTANYNLNDIIANGFRASSSSNTAKLKSLANYNCVVIEEADEVSEQDFMTLDDSLRTTKGDIKIILLLNTPAKSHWIIRRWFDCEDYFEDGEKIEGFYKPVLKPECNDTVFIEGNWQVNSNNIDISTANRYEGYRKTKPAYYWQVIKGLVPETLRGKIYTGWKELTEIPHEARLLCYGLDFGFHPDPCAIVAIYYYNGGYILKQICYQTDLMNSQIAQIFKNLPKAPIYADSAEPKSIAELQEEGLLVFPADKGPDSIRAGIKKIQEMRISFIGRELGLEFDGYCWKSDKNGVEESVPNPSCSDHLLDAAKYGLTSLQKNSHNESKDIVFRKNEKRMPMNSTK